MHSSCHTLEQYRSGWGSPAQILQAVGSSAKSTQLLERAQKREESDETTLNALGVALLLVASPTIENSLETAPAFDCAPWDVNSDASMPILESGEGVVRSGDVIQATDYYPYGATRVDQATSTFEEQRKFIGHEYDEEADLTYANARYYEQNVGRWTAQDPASRDNPSQFLADPQQMNYYSYGRNNPVNATDPSGKDIRWEGRGLPLGFTHTFTRVINPQRPDLINYAALGIPEDTKEFTIGYYNPGTGHLVSEIYYEGSESKIEGAAADFYGKSKTSGAYTVTGLSGEVEAQAINTIGGLAVDFNDEAFDYKAGAINSNSGNRTGAEVAGLGSQYKNFNPGGGDFGRRFMLPSSSFNSSVNQRIVNLVTQINKLQEQLSELQE